jgi:hypothetical protein
VEDVGDKEAVLAAHPAGFFTIPHFDGFPAVLVQLAEVSVPTLSQALVDPWLVHAPPEVASEYLGRS